VVDTALFRRLRVAGIGLLSLIAVIEIVRAGLAWYYLATGSTPNLRLGPIFSSIALAVGLAFYFFVFDPAYRGLRALTKQLEEQHVSDTHVVDRFRSIFEHHSDAALAIDTLGNYLLVNAPMERLSGFRAEELNGNAFKLTPPDFALQVHEAVSLALAGTPTRYDGQLMCKDGTRCDVSADLIPMLEDGRVVGVYGFFKDVGEIKRAQRLERTQRDRFRAVSVLAAASGDVGKVIERTLTFAIESLKADAANVALLHGDAMTIVHGAGDTYERGIIVPVEQTFSRHVIGLRDVLVVRDADEEPWLSDSAHKWQPWRSYLATTLFLDGAAAGVLSFVSRNPRVDDEADGDFVLVIASLIASALERERREQQLSEMAFVDALTTLPNRAYFSEQVDLACADARRHGGSFAVQYVDLDGFKAVNDRFGHEAGDHVLSVIAARLKMAVRDADVIARFGGDEFVVLQTKLEDENAISRLASRLIEVAGEALIVNDETITLGASVGVARFPSDAQSSEDLLRCADAAMYRAKRAGRNRLEIYA